MNRPPAERQATTVSPERLAQFASWFRPAAEVIAGFRAVHQQADSYASRQEVLALLQRRPCSVADIASGLGMRWPDKIDSVQFRQSQRLSNSIL